MEHLETKDNLLTLLWGIEQWNFLCNFRMLKIIYKCVCVYVWGCESVCVHLPKTKHIISIHYAVQGIMLC